MFTSLRLWWSGWRVDLDGFYVRARRASDPNPIHVDINGFSEEACVAVGSEKEAALLDRLSARERKQARRAG